MFCNSIEKIINSLGPDTSILVAETPEIKTLLIQDLMINGINYLALRNIEIHPDFQNMGIFSVILKKLVSIPGRNVLVEDILNPFIWKKCVDMGFEKMFRDKNGDNLLCMRKMAETPENKII